MEIKINIPKNDYVQSTEVRQNVVQAICDAFLESHCNSTFHPYGSGCCRRKTLFVHPKTKNTKTLFKKPLFF